MASENDKDCDRDAKDADNLDAFLDYLKNNQAPRKALFADIKVRLETTAAEAHLPLSPADYDALRDECEPAATNSGADNVEKKAWSQ